MHYPTDIGLLYDAVRKVIQLTAQLSESHGLSEWRQHGYNVKQVKKQLRIVQKKKHISGRTQVQKAEIETAMKSAHQELLVLSQLFLTKAKVTCDVLKQAQPLNTSDLAFIDNIGIFSAHADRQISQIKRRVLQGETIPHDEKVLSVFELHTEWISKGKVGVPVELGLRVCVLEDQHQFILHHRVMEKETDNQVAVPMVKAAKKAFPTLKSCSFDKGFHSPNNQERLKEELEVVALKRKGKLSQKAKEIESTPAFKTAQKKHSAVESAINALEVHGLDKCPDHGIEGFKRYVGLAVLSRNIHRLGVIVCQKEQAKLTRKWRHALFKLAA